MPDIKVILGIAGNRMDMAMQTATKESGAASGHEAVRMYPDNRLPDQVRDVTETTSLFGVVKRAFETNV